MSGDNANIDLDITAYTQKELFQILDLEDPTEQQIKDATTLMINKMSLAKNNDLKVFFTKVQDRLLTKGSTTRNYERETRGYNKQFDPDTQIGRWWLHEWQEQRDNQVQFDKITEREQKIDVFDKSDRHFPMTRQQLGINENYQVPVVQDVLNPNLKNTITRIVCIDSQYRQIILPFAKDDVNLPSFNTDYALDLSDPLKNVLSITLKSVEIPTTWYTFAKSLGNTCVDMHTENESVEGGEAKTTCICIDDGNYTMEGLLAELEDKFYPLTFVSDETLDLSGNFVARKARTNIIHIENPAELGGETITLVFYKPNGFDCNRECGAHTYMNNSLGWYLGFRREPDQGGVVSITLRPGDTISADVPVNIYGPKYFILSVDDYNQNHLNKGLVNIIKRPTKLNLPDYYNPVDMVPNPTDLPNQSKCFAVKQAPRKLTQAQLYSINEIMINRTEPRTRTPGPTTTDVLAIIPLRNVTKLKEEGTPYVEFGSYLQTNKRVYFGPVNIERMRVRLLDDKGNLVNLHDSDWSFTLTVEHLYQY